MISTRSQPKDFDDLLLDIGQFGKYQALVYSIPCFLSVLTGMQILMPVYLLNNVNHRCHLPQDSSWFYNDTFEVQSKEHQESINKYISNATENHCSFRMNLSSGFTNCSKWVYDTSNFDDNFVTQLNLVCDSKGLGTLISTLTFAGTLVGVFVSGILSDYIGRRLSFIIFVNIFFVSATMSIFSITAVMMAICRFFIGFGSIGSFTISYVIGVEIVGPDVRYHTGMIVEYFWTFGVMILAGIAYGLRSWRNIQIAITCPVLLIAVLSISKIIVPESPRWLYSHNKKDEAEIIMKRIISWNKVEVKKNILDNLDFQTNPSAKKTSVMHEICAYPQILFRFGIICFNWFVIAMVYYGISMGSGNLPGSIYLTSFLTGAVELPGWGLAHVTINKLGRKRMHIASMLLTGLFLIGLLLANQQATNKKWLIITLSMLGKLFNSTAFGIIYVWTGELYPTTVRNSGLAFSSMFARFGTLLAPVLADIQKFIPGQGGLIISYLIFASLTLLAAMLCFFVPETKDQKLYETIQAMMQQENRKVKPKDEIPLEENNTENDLTA